MDTIFLVKKFKGRLGVDVGRRVVSKGFFRNCGLYEGLEFDVHVTVHRDKFLIIKPTRCTNFSYLFLE
jgi:hypothetical protein